ncbi:hypothetical protein HMPREF2822_08700 [Corynebacterium sp. HMSC062E11]|uniref:lysylphosphatidylglycerol synthase transmembrane domain-containing protein n=1 Tax=unclassified Corynebacterium TaxID=2624378 RepID=UPI0008A522B0|nr:MULTISPECIES: YbhN family protein [unclassified Corynebacterium]MDK6806409.1 YbhN family protein [Corynebacterium aurimucosum]NJJ83494.1 UPF0104 family protein [Corynebacterium aurimucosum]OFK29096.1 hypothetical protein HMPREF2822_08700 [Corynebacterium sp. HMSC062E11]OFK60282.1 hypothetical protein HMPREF2808_07425 [Corynebacterium sp. HMSC078A10]OFQ90280.1 hypothetical protein HMPREF2912_06820 [Corynebacterium sp. HMSC056E09]
MKKNWLTWIVSLLILAALAWFFRDQLDFISEGLQRLRHTEPFPVVLVVFFALLSIAGMAEVMKRLIGAGGVKVPLRETYAITLASNAWSTTLPAGPAFSALLTFQVQRRWGASVALCSYFLFLSSIISSMFLALIGLGGVFFLNADMALGSLITTVVLMLAALGGVFWLTSHPVTLEGWLRKLRPGPKRDRAIQEVRNLGEVHLSRGPFAVVAGASLVHRLGDMAALWASVWAVTGEIPWLRAGADDTTLAGVALAFLAAKLAGSAQVTPGGVGTVEAALITPLVATGLTVVHATSAAIIYRLISFALITIIGWVIYFAHYARDGFSYAALNRKES